jgi:hypothetical protein
MNPHPFGTVSEYECEMERPSYDLLLIPIGLLYPVVGFYLFGVMGRAFGFYLYDFFIFCPVVPLVGMIGVLIARALGTRFTRFGIALFAAWMIAMGFGLRWFIWEMAASV